MENSVRCFLRIFQCPAIKLNGITVLTGRLADLDKETMILRGRHCFDSVV